MQGAVANEVNGGVERSETAHVATTRREAGATGADEAIGADQATGATKAVGQTRPQGKSKSRTRQKNGPEAVRLSGHSGIERQAVACLT